MTPAEPRPLILITPIPDPLPPLPGFTPHEPDPVIIHVTPVADPLPPLPGFTPHEPKPIILTTPAVEQKPDILITPIPDQELPKDGGFTPHEPKIEDYVESFPIAEGEIGIIFEFKPDIDGKKFQEHHIISDKNKETQEHKLWELAGLDKQARGNKIYLPTKEEYHPTRSVHYGRHLKIVSEKLREEMNRVRDIGETRGWTQAQYKEALSDILWAERAKLRSGERALNKNKREWAEEQK